MSPPAEYRPGAAVAWMLCAVAVLCLMDACLKQLSGHYPALQVAALRGLVGLPLVLVYHVIIYRTFRGRVKEEDLAHY